MKLFFIEGNSESYKLLILVYSASFMNQLYPSICVEDLADAQISCLTDELS